MIPITVPNRPFSTDLITNLMLPDGIFEISLGKQRINAYFRNIGVTSTASSKIFIESASDPNIIVTATTHYVYNLIGGASTLLSWDIDITNASIGTHYISFIVQNDSGRARIIKKIFITNVLFDPTSKTFTAQTPEGLMHVQFKDLIKPKGSCCKINRKNPSRGKYNEITNPISLLHLFREYDKDFVFCPQGYLPHNIEFGIIPTPPFSGQYGDLPFQDPWWKIILCIIAVLLLIASAIAEAVGGSGDVTVSSGSSSGDTPNCCGVKAEGGGSSYVAAGLAACSCSGSYSCRIVRCTRPHPKRPR